MGPIQFGILPGDRILKRFQVGEDHRVWQGFPQAEFNLFQQVVAALNSPFPRNQHMK